MFRNTRAQMAAVLAAGVLLGYLAASGRWNPASWAGTTSPAAQARDDTSAKPDPGEKPACCEEVNKAQLVALADPKLKEKISRAQEKTNGKPNILFIIAWVMNGHSTGDLQCFAAREPKWRRSSPPASCSATWPRRAG